MRVFVVGATGVWVRRTGRHMLMRLVERGHSVAVVARQAEDETARGMLPEPPAGVPPVTSLGLTRLGASLAILPRWPGVSKVTGQV